MGRSIWDGSPNQDRPLVAPTPEQLDAAELQRLRGAQSEDLHEPILVSRSMSFDILKVQPYPNGEIELIGIMGVQKVTAEEVEAMIDALREAVDWTADQG